MKKNNHTFYTAGFTLVEVLAVVFIIAVVATIVLYSLPAQRSSQVLNNGEDEIIALVNEARSRTLSAEGNISYGVHFESGRIVLFPGSVFYDGLAGNREVTFDSTVTLTSISLASGTPDIIFQKLTGETDEYGTMILKNTATTTGEKTITISRAGLVSGN